MHCRLLSFFILAVSTSHAVWHCNAKRHPLIEKISHVAAKGSPEFPPPPATLMHGVWFHIFHTANGTGKLTTEQLVLQIAQLNKAFSTPHDSQFRFYLKGYEYIQNEAAFDTCSVEQTMIPHAIKPAIYLNVYTCNLPWFVGEAAMPGMLDADFRPVPNTSPLFGIRLDHRVFAGSTDPYYPQYHLGNVLVHEVGHFYGLLHLYLDGCNLPTDHIADTPRSAHMLLGSCASLRGSWTCKKIPPGNPPDDYSNYMFQTDDACRNHFTPGQITFMHASVVLFHPQLLG